MWIPTLTLGSYLSLTYYPALLCMLDIWLDKNVYFWIINTFENSLSLDEVNGYFTVESLVCLRCICVLFETELIQRQLWRSWDTCQMYRNLAILFIAFLMGFVYLAFYQGFLELLEWFFMTHQDNFLNATSEYFLFILKAFSPWWDDWRFYRIFTRINFSNLIYRLTIYTYQFFLAYPNIDLEIRYQDSLSWLRYT
jgi:hypothetical protein